MEKVGVLISQVFRTCMIGLMIAGQANLFAAEDEWTAAELSAEEQYRQLNLIVMISEGVEAPFLQQLQTASGQDESMAKRGQQPQINLDDFQSPLNRIVDQRELIGEASWIFQYALDNSEAISRELESLAENNPNATASVDLVPLAEDAILIRTALSGSIETLSQQGNPAMQPDLEAYQNRTVYLRNVMEYWKFDAELTAITNEAMDQTGGRMDAYQRLLEDQPHLRSFRRHLQSVENIYRKSKDRKMDTPEQVGDALIEEEANDPAKHFPLRSKSQGSSEEGSSEETGTSSADEPAPMPADDPPA